MPESHANHLLRKNLAACKDDDQESSEKHCQSLHVPFLLV